MRNGLIVYFGDATRPHAKWLALASVLADKSSAGATYVDVRLPGRPAAGFPPGTGPAHAEESATGESRQGSSESTVSALAAGLAAANPATAKNSGEEEASPGATSEAHESSAPTASESSPPAASEAGEAGSGESGEAGSGEASGGTTEPGG
jgi:hypothetical protein